MFIQQNKAETSRMLTQSGKLLQRLSSTAQFSADFTERWFLNLVFFLWFFWFSVYIFKFFYLKGNGRWVIQKIQQNIKKKEYIWEISTIFCLIDRKKQWRVRSQDEFNKDFYYEIEHVWDFSRWFEMYRILKFIVKWKYD